MPRPNRPLVAAPTTLRDRIGEWITKYVTNGLVLVVMAVAVFALSISTLFLGSQLISANEDRKDAEGAGECRSRISSQVATVETDLSKYIGVALLHLGESRDPSFKVYVLNIQETIDTLGKVQPIREQSVDICSSNPEFRLNIPPYAGHTVEA